MKIITYEQPVNELIRTCLRLERLFQQIEFHLPQEESWHSRIALEALLDIIILIDRSDLKTLLLKEFLRQEGILLGYEKNPQINSTKLQYILRDISSILQQLNTTTGRFGKELRDNEFLAAIRVHLLNPGGAAGFENPAYHYWLQQPAFQRIKSLKGWLADVEFVKRCIHLLLQLVRESFIPEDKVTSQGYYQMNLDPKNPCQLVRVVVNADDQVLPEISAGFHRICIRFYSTTFTERMKPIAHEVCFKLTCCIA